MFSSLLKNLKIGLFDRNQSADSQSGGQNTALLWKGLDKIAESQVLPPIKKSNRKIRDFDADITENREQESQLKDDAPPIKKIATSEIYSS